MNLIFRILFYVSLLHASYGVIYHLNASEFSRMPPVYKLDNYNSCLQKPPDVYCMIFFKLVSDVPNELLHMIEEYSEHTKTHFDHTRLRYGVCVTQNCQEFIHKNTSVSKTTLERCLNQTFYDNYQLKTKIQHYYCYGSSDKEINIENSDLVAGIILFAVIMLCIIGSIYDIYCTSKKCEDIYFLQLFSLQRNWKKLTLTKFSREARFRNLKGLNGIKCLGALLVIGTHCIFVFFILGENIHDIELSYKNLGMKILVGGPIMIHTYFVISAFLLTYNIEVYAEKHSINLSTVWKAILYRYVRLTPSYALVILLSATWLKFLGSGPLWKFTGLTEMIDCKNRWWINLLYVNNYVFNFQCVPTSWYLAADTQLFCCGLVIYVLLRNSRFKNTILVSLTALGSIIVAIHTYVRDLDHNVLYAPSPTSELTAEDPTFNETYQMGHANICSSVIGMALGYLVYRWQQKKIDFRKYKLLKYVYWTVVPILFGVVLSGSFFYKDGPREPVYMRALYAALAKPVVALLIAILISGTIFRFDSVYHKVLELNLWMTPSKLSYGAFLVHFPILLIYVIRQTELIQMNAFNIMALIFCINVASFVTAIPLYLFVESPCTELIKHFVQPPKPEAVVADSYKKTVTEV